MSTDNVAEEIQRVPNAEASQFRAYELWYQNRWPWQLVVDPWTRLKETRRQLANALRLYRTVFTEWAQFQAHISSTLSAPAAAPMTPSMAESRPQTLKFKDAASRAIEGMPESELARHLKALDSRFAALCQISDVADVHEQAERLLLAFDTTREITMELANACGKAQADLAAAKVNLDQVIEYRRIVGDPGKLQRFLQGQFPKSWAALSDGRPLVDIAEEIVRKLQSGQPVN